MALQCHLMCGPVRGYFSEMWIIYVSVFSIWALLSSAENNVYYTNGWIPVSSEIVYNQIKRESVQRPSYTSTHNIQVINTDINKVLSNENKFGIEERIADDIQTNIKACVPTCVTKDVTSYQNEKTMNNPIVDSEYDFVPNVYNDPSKYYDTVEKPARRSKKIADFNFKSNLQQLLLSEAENISTNTQETTYEVTEESHLDEMFEQERSETKKSGYKYEPPKKQHKTRGLFEILSKYKINKDDELPNYAISRRQKIQVPLNKNLPVKPFQNQILYKYNNLNHLPVDPLLAVFLSNYGYYLQGTYGIHNHFNNLYGYLASNNIHNNRPFGLYKVFSDTDSSH